MKISFDMLFSRGSQTYVSSDDSNLPYFYIENDIHY
jgi:hypothetical protein